MKKVVLKVGIHDHKMKKKALKAVCSFLGVQSILINMKLKELSIMGDIDAAKVVAELKFCHAEMVYVGLAKEEKKIHINMTSTNENEIFPPHKVVLKLEIQDDKMKIKTMKAVCGFSGVESISMDMKVKELTLTGDINPTKVAAKLKFCHADIIYFGQEKEEKKEDDKNKNKDSTKENNQISPLQSFLGFGRALTYGLVRKTSLLRRSGSKKYSPI